MNREIKFRVWNRKRNKFIQDWIIGVIEGADTNNGLVGFISKDKEDNLWLTQGDYKIEDIKVQQFTGSKDVNGKDIYEGDIIKYYIRSIEDKDDRGHEDRSSVIYFNSYFAFSNILYDDCQKMPLDFNVGVLGTKILVEVIGNIFENPELLTK